MGPTLFPHSRLLRALVSLLKRMAEAFGGGGPHGLGELFEAMLGDSGLVAFRVFLRNLTVEKTGGLGVS